MQFHPVPGAVGALKNLPGNELVVRLQPEEAIYWKVQNKVPGLGFEVQQMRMDLLYASKWNEATLKNLPEAYERLLLEVRTRPSQPHLHSEGAAVRGAMPAAAK